MPSSQKRFLQRCTTWGLMPSRAAISAIVVPSAAISTNFARRTSQKGTGLTARPALQLGAPHGGPLHAERATGLVPRGRHAIASSPWWPSVIDHRYPRDQGAHCPLKKAVLPSPVSSWDLERDGTRPEHRSVGGDHYYFGFPRIRLYCSVPLVSSPDAGPSTYLRGRPLSWSPTEGPRKQVRGAPRTGQRLVRRLRRTPHQGAFDERDASARPVGCCERVERCPGMSASSPVAGLGQLGQGGDLFNEVSLRLTVANLTSSSDCTGRRPEAVVT